MQEAGQPAILSEDRPLKILHLSDLHFGAMFDPSLWSYVGSVLDGTERPNLVVVTGDLVDSPTYFMLGLARNELISICKQWCNSDVPCGLQVIPGNHDVGLLGNWAPWPLRNKFKIVFAERYSQIFDRLPTFTQWRQRHWARRLSDRLIAAFKFAFLRVTFQLRCPDKLPMVVSCAGNRLCVAKFDSNHNLRLASGYVSADAIAQAHGELLSQRVPSTDRKLRNLVPRIALVHHHVLAIPYSGAREALTDFEPFLTLRNAGTLLKELTEWDFDLVLHGHKHLLNFARLTFDSADQPRTEIAVLSAGTATKRQTSAGQNSFNLIKVHRNGTVSFRSVRYGLGASGQLEGLWSSGFQRLLPLRDLKLRSFSRARAGQELWCETNELSYSVEESGAATGQRSVVGLKGLNEEKLRDRRLRFSVEFGAIAANSFVLDQASIDAGHVLVSAPQSPQRSAEVRIRLAQPQAEETAGSNFGVRWKVVSSFATSHWECSAMGQKDGRDWVSLDVLVPTRQLRLAVRLPDRFRNPQPKLRVWRCPTYPLLDVDEQGDIDETKALGEWTLDPDLTELERPQVRLTDDTWEVVVDYPIVGHRYELRWRVDVDSGPTSTQRAEVARQIRRTLLDIGRKEPGRPELLASQANEMLGKLAVQFVEPLIGSRFALDERLDCALFAYDDEAREFRLVASGGNKAVEHKLISIPLNAGVTGAAFKHRGVSLYIQHYAPGLEASGAYVYPPSADNSSPDYAALLAIPLSLGDVDPTSQEGTAEAPDLTRPAPPEEAIGVFTIASTASDSKLISLEEAGQQAQKNQ